MGLEPLIYPQIGHRQFGVDLVAVGNIEDEVETLYVFTIKQGDISRSDWDSDEQSVRQSLNEIKDVYLNSLIRPEHKNYRKKVILCTGGVLECNVGVNWKNYIEQNTVPDKLIYEFWGGDKLSLLIEKHMMNENIFPKEIKSYFRKTLVRLTDPDYDLEDYYKLLDNIILKTDYGDISNRIAKKRITKNFKTINLSLNIIYQWARHEDNLKPALYCAERTILLCWEFIRSDELFEKKWISDLLLDINSTFEKIYLAYYVKIRDHCIIPNALSGYHTHFVLESLNIFEQLGIITNFGLIQLYHSKQFVKLHGCNPFTENLKSCCSSIKSLINNHKALLNPVFDGHINEISSTIFLLSELKEFEFIKQWISDLFEHIFYAYIYLGKYFPIYTDSFDDLVSFNISNGIEKEKLFEISSIIPILAQWCVVLDFEELFNHIKNRTKNNFDKCTFQIFYPDNETDNHLYCKNAATESGIAEAPIILKSFEEMKKQIGKVKSKKIKKDEISSIKYSFPILPLIAFRHYRTPMFPMYWQDIIEN